MREFINGILSFIGTSSLTDEEFSSISLSSYGYDQATYEAIAGVLTSRNSISTMHDRLASYFKAKGVELTEVETGKSNILVGSVL